MPRKRRAGRGRAGGQNPRMGGDASRQCRRCNKDRPARMFRAHSAKHYDNLCMLCRRKEGFPVMGYGEDRKKVCERSCDRKKAYWTRKEAQAVARKKSSMELILYTYRCTECGTWHLTSTRTEDGK